MKKYFFLLLFVMVFSSFTFANETIKNVSLNFCNDWTGNLTNKYTLMIEPWKQQDLCIYIENKSNQAAKMMYSFPKASISRWWNQICNNWNDFAKFFLDNSVNPDRSVIVSWNSTLTIKETIQAPAGMIWMYYGCLAYQLWTAEVGDIWWVFNMVIRKVTFVNMFVWSEDSIKI
jgi:hypothetical protein